MILDKSNRNIKWRRRGGGGDNPTQNKAALGYKEMQREKKKKGCGVRAETVRLQSADRTVMTHSAQCHWLWQQHTAQQSPLHWLYVVTDWRRPSGKKPKDCRVDDQLSKIGLTCWSSSVTVWIPHWKPKSVKPKAQTASWARRRRNTTQTVTTILRCTQGLKLR